MKTAVVMELRDGRAVVLRSDGAFLSVRSAAGWQVGDTVAVPKERRRPRMLYAAACLALMFCGTLAGFLYYSEAALVSLDVNPSIELRLNRFDRVVSASAMNPEGHALLDSVDPRGRTYTDAVGALLESETMSAYLDGSANITFAVQAGSETTRDSVLAGLARTVDSTAHHPGTWVEYHAVDSATVESAHNHGVTAGKYLALAELAEADPAVDIDAYAHHSIPEIREETARCRERHRYRGGHHQ